MSEAAKLEFDKALKRMWADKMKWRRERGLCETCGEAPYSVKQEARCSYPDEHFVGLYCEKCWTEIRSELIKKGITPEEADASVTFNFRVLEEV